jgi:hypothetical protein
MVLWTEDYPAGNVLIQPERAGKGLGWISMLPYQSLEAIHPLI